MISFHLHLQRRPGNESLTEANHRLRIKSSAPRVSRPSLSSGSEALEAVRLADRHQQIIGFDFRFSRRDHLEPLVVAL